MVKGDKADKQAARKEHLSAALRENLKRRKQQARDRRLLNQDLPDQNQANKDVPDEDAPGAAHAESRIGSRLPPQSER